MTPDERNERWLKAMAEDIDSMGSDELAAIAEREERVGREIDEIEGGTHPLCRQPAA